MYRGEFTVGNETYSVEPVDETLSGRHRVYKESDSIRPAHTCGKCSTFLLGKLLPELRKTRQVHVPVSVLPWYLTVVPNLHYPEAQALWFPGIK